MPRRRCSEAIWVRVETRSGDTPQNRRERQRVRPPQILLTTPASLALLLSYPDSADYFAGRDPVLDAAVRYKP